MGSTKSELSEEDKDRILQGLSEIKEILENRPEAFGLLMGTVAQANLSYNDKAGRFIGKNQVQLLRNWGFILPVLANVESEAGETAVLGGATAQPYIDDVANALDGQVAEVKERVEDQDTPSGLGADWFWDAVGDLFG